MKPFVIIAEARTGSSYICKELDKHSDISFTDNYEPFSLSSKNNSSIQLGGNILDFDYFFQKLPQNNYSGFKTFYRYHNDLEKAISDYDVTPICITRKDAMKYLGSVLVILQSRGNPYLKSSKDYKKYRMNITPETMHVIYVHIDNYLKHNFYISKYHRDSIIYFEDFVNNKTCTNEYVNDFFNREIIFNSSYDDTASAAAYFENYEDVKQLVCDFIHSNRNIYSYIDDEIIGPLLDL